MPKYTLESVKNEEKISKAGKSYIQSSIKIAGIWHNGLGNKVTEEWQPGDEVQVELYEEEYNGNMYKKFKYISERKEMLSRIARLEKVVTALYKDMEKIKANMFNSAMAGNKYQSPSGRDVEAHGLEDECEDQACPIHKTTP